MKCRIIGGKITELNTINSDTELPNELLGTHLSKWNFDQRNKAFNIDKTWVKPNENIIDDLTRNMA
jgi:hypothetical protein